MAPRSLLESKPWMTGLITELLHLESLLFFPEKEREKTRLRTKERRLILGFLARSLAKTILHLDLTFLFPSRNKNDGVCSQAFSAMTIGRLQQ